MAEQKGALRLRGKHGDIVFTQTKFGSKTRQAPTLSEAVRAERSTRPQNQRTSSLNKLSGTIVRGLRQHAPKLINTNVYAYLQSFIKSEQTLELPILLDKIKKVDLRPDNPFSRFHSGPEFIIEPTETSYRVNMTISGSPLSIKRSNSFYAQVILLVWRGDMTQCISVEGSTEWMLLTDKFPKSVKMEFDKSKDDTDYLIACRYVCAKNCIEDEKVVTQGIRFYTAGTLTKRGQKILEKHLAEIKAKQEAQTEVAVVAERKRWKME